MSLQVECYECGKRYRLRDDMAGRTIPCRECGASIRVGGRRGGNGSGGSMDSHRPLILGGGALIVVLIGMVCYLLGRGSGPAPNNDGGQVAQNNSGNQVSQETSNSGGLQNSGTTQTPVTSQPWNNRTSSGSSSTTPRSNPRTTPRTQPNQNSPTANTNRSFPEAKPVAQAAFGNDAGPAKGGNSAEGSWSGDSIPFDERGGLTFGPAGCPVLVSGNKVWDWEKKEVIQELEGTYEGRGLTSLSPDGRFFAAADRSENQKETTVTVWSTETGKTVFKAPGDEERFADLIVLSNEKLFIGGRLSNEIRVWELEGGQQLDSLTPVERGGFKNSNTGLTLDGQYLATADKNRLIVARTDTGKSAAVMAAPLKLERPKPGAPQMIAPSKEPINRRERATENDATFIYAWLQSVNFSADSQELAAVSTNPVPSIMCWNNRGKLVYHEPYYAGRRAFWENSMQWFPDRSAWLVQTDVIDRGAGRIVLSIRERFAQHLKLHVLDDAHLIGTFPHNPSELEVLEIPWTRIRDSLASLENNDAALLSPASPVRLEIQLGNLRGQALDTELAIRSAFASRLGRDGISIDKDGEAVFRLKFAETAGDTLPIYERQSVFDFRGRNTGRTATEAKGTLVAELVVPGRDGPIWRDTLNVESSRSFQEDINDATIRKSMLERLAFEVYELNFPYFIPASDELIALPIVLQ